MKHFLWCILLLAACGARDRELRVVRPCVIDAQATRAESRDSIDAGTDVESKDQDAGDACANMFSGPEYEVPSEPVSFVLGRPATLEGARATLCTRMHHCNVSMLLPAGDDEATGDRFFVSRTNATAEPADRRSCMTGNPEDFIDYYLLVEHKGKIVRVQWLVDTGDLCSHWQDEEVTVGPNEFRWRESGYGSPGPSTTQRRLIDLSTLHVDGCTPPHVSPGIPIIRHPFG